MANLVFAAAEGTQGLLYGTHLVKGNLNADAKNTLTNNCGTTIGTCYIKIYGYQGRTPVYSITHKTGQQIADLLTEGIYVDLDNQSPAIYQEDYAYVAIGNNTTQYFNVRLEFPNSSYYLNRFISSGVTPNAVDGSMIKKQSIEARHLLPGAVSAESILNGTIGMDKLSPEVISALGEDVTINGGTLTPVSGKYKKVTVDGEDYFIQLNRLSGIFLTANLYRYVYYDNPSVLFDPTYEKKTGGAYATDLTTTSLTASRPKFSDYFFANQPNQILTNVSTRSRLKTSDRYELFQIRTNNAARGTTYYYTIYQCVDANATGTCTALSSLRKAGPSSMGWTTPNTYATPGINQTLTNPYSYTISSNTTIATYEYHYIYAKILPATSGTQFRIDVRKDSATGPILNTLLIGNTPQTSLTIFSNPIVDVVIPGPTGEECTNYVDEVGNYVVDFNYTITGITGGSDINYMQLCSAQYPLPTGGGATVCSPASVGDGIVNANQLLNIPLSITFTPTSTLDIKRMATVVYDSATGQRFVKMKEFNSSTCKSIPRPGMEPIFD